MDDANHRRMGAALCEVTMMKIPRVLRLAPTFTLTLLIGPILLGLTWTVLPAFGWLPAIGGTSLTLEGWHALLTAPGFTTALRLTTTSGLITTVFALAIATGFCTVRAGTGAQLAPLLASPHSSMALGFAFLVMPSGWLVRLLSHFSDDLQQPPRDLVTIQDPWGASYIAGLLLSLRPARLADHVGRRHQRRPARTPPEARDLPAARPLPQQGRRRCVDRGDRCALPGAVRVPLRSDSERAGVSR